VSVDSLIDSCILDVTCIFYIYPNRSWLDIYKVVNDTILFRDNKGFSIIGMGTFWIRMYDDIIRTLKVWHVPKMKKNLISFSLLDFKGYGYSNTRRVLKVRKADLVVMKGKLVNDLYHLQGSTIIDLTHVSCIICCLFGLWFYLVMTRATKTYEWEGDDRVKQITFAMWSENK
jgi:hypothetical protein